MSAPKRITDLSPTSCHVRLVPRTVSCVAAIDRLYSTTLSAVASSVAGTTSPSALAGFEVDRQFKFGNLIKRNISGMGAAKDGVDVASHPLGQLLQVEGVSHQAAGIDGSTNA